MRTLKPMPAALTAGSQTRVRKVLREIGVPARGGEEQVVAAELVGGDVGGELVEPGLAEADRAGLVVLGVGLDDHALAGGGVLRGDLDDGLLDGDCAAEEVEVRGRGRSSSPQRRPVSIAVSTISRCRSGTAWIRAYSSGVRVWVLRTILGSSPATKQNRRSAPGSWVTTGPVLAFGVSRLSADIASDGPEWASIAEERRRLAKLRGRSNRVTSLPLTQRSHTRTCSPA